MKCENYPDEQQTANFGSAPAASAPGGMSARGQAHLEHDLRHAVASNTLHLHWQPILHCVLGRLHRFEALVRWNRPGAGPVSPDVFVPIAEHIGLHRELDLWVLRHAMTEAAGWPEPVRVAVNVSALWFHGEDLSRSVRALLAETRLDPGRLELEVTERAFIGDAPAAVREFAQFRAMGVGLSLDDFGTGYSALSYLRNLSFTKLKMDRVFIERLGSCHRTEVIVRAVLAMGDGLGMPVCAEGVSRPEHLELLQAYGCDEAQGYLLGRPGPLTPSRMDACLALGRGSPFGPALAGMPASVHAVAALP